MNKNLFLIHGAWASEKAFSYIVSKVLSDCGVVNVHSFRYDCQKEHMEQIIERSNKELDLMQSNGLETVIVGHSLGGLIALDLSQNDGVSKSITLASPLSGINFPRVMQFYLSYHAPVIKQISPTSKFIRNIHNKKYGKNPIDVIVSTEGFNPLIYEDSDGVVTVDSQTTWTPDPSTMILSSTNHHEILQSAEVVNHIEKALTSQ